MADLREVRRKLAQSKREAEEYEAEIRRAKVEPKLDAMTKIWMKDDNFCEKLSSLTSDEAKILAKKFSEELDEIFEKSMPEIEESRTKKKERSERRKARQQEKDENESENDSDKNSDNNSVSDSVSTFSKIAPPSDDEPVEMVTDPETGMRVKRKGMTKVTNPETGEELVFMNGRLVK